MKIRYITFIVIFCLFASCKKETDDVKTTPKKKFHKLEKAKWFLGSWSNITKDAVFVENWGILNDSTFNAQSYITSYKDTIFNEHIELIEKNDSLFYIVSSKGQNNEESVPFYLTNSNDSQLTFENPKHDFPTKITYTKITKDSIVAEISGLLNGKQKSEIFSMKKHILY